MTKLLLSIIILAIGMFPSTIFSQGQLEPNNLNKKEEKKTKLLVKTNALADIATILNIGAEYNLSNKWSVDLPIYYSPFSIGSTVKARVFIVQPEVKYWLKETPFDGHYVGFNVATGWYNVAFNKERRYQDNKMIMSAGFTYGYYHQFANTQYILGFSIGAGYAHFGYDKFQNSDNKEKLGTGIRNYVGITQLAVTFAYRIDL